MIQKTAIPKILHVEDNPVLTELVRDILSSSNYDLVQAENGKIGKELLDSNPDVSLIITDIKMPECGGIEFIEYVRSSAKHSRKPIIVLSALGTIEDSMRAKELNIQKWLIQPLGFDQLEEVIIEYLDQAV